MAKPADSYIGVTDIFSILLPGAVVTWSGWLWMKGDFDPTGRLPEGEVAIWVAFILTAYAAMRLCGYAAGHFVFLLASWVDFSFGPFRRYVVQRFMTKKAAR